MKARLSSSSPLVDLKVSILSAFDCIKREEEQARERARAEQLRKERELLAQKEDAARQARKKVKLENI